MMSKLLITLSLLVSFGCAAAKPVVANKDRTINIVGEVGPSILLKANEMLALAEKSKEPIFILINSPGGSVAFGEMFIDAMELVKSRGIKIECATTILAASMAYSIISHCDARYATPNALLLFHPARVGGNLTLTDKEAQIIADELRELNEELLDYLEDLMGMDREILEKAFYQEKFWNARKLAKLCKRGFLIIVTDIQGIDSKLYNIQEE
jgi:ATP-dependent Clp protease protease subunit